jgi:hypothetical protein
MALANGAKRKKPCLPYVMTQGYRVSGVWCCPVQGNHQAVTNNASLMYLRAEAIALARGSSPYAKP